MVLLQWTFARDRSPWQTFVTDTHAPGMSPQITNLTSSKGDAQEGEKKTRAQKAVAAQGPVPRHIAVLLMLSRGQTGRDRAS